MGWRVVEVAAEEHLVLDQVDTFNKDDCFPDYSQVGYRSMDKRFNIDGAIIHTFRLAPLPPLCPIETIPEEVEKEDIGGIVNFATIFCNQNRHTPERRSLYPPSYTHHISFWEN